MLLLFALLLHDKRSKFESVSDRLQIRNSQVLLLWLFLQLLLRLRLLLQLSLFLLFLLLFRPDSYKRGLLFSRLIYVAEVGAFLNGLSFLHIFSTSWLRCLGWRLSVQLLLIQILNILIILIILILQRTLRKRQLICLLNIWRLLLLLLNLLNLVTNIHRKVQISIFLLFFFILCLLRCIYLLYVGDLLVYL